MIGRLSIVFELFAEGVDMERMNIFEKREEPIKVAEMLITASCEYEPSEF